MKVGIVFDQSVTKESVTGILEDILSTIEDDDIEFVINNSNEIFEHTFRKYHFRYEILEASDEISFVTYIDQLNVLWDGSSKEVTEYMIASLISKTNYFIYFTKPTIWTYINKVDAICFYTDCYVDPQTHTTYMYSEYAKQLKYIMPGIESTLAEYLIKRGISIHILCSVGNANARLTQIVALPYKKDFYVENSVVIPGYAYNVDTHLLSQSFSQLATLLKQYSWKKVLLPKPAELTKDKFFAVLFASSLMEVSSSILIFLDGKQYTLDVFKRGFINVNSEMVTHELSFC